MYIYSLNSDSSMGKFDFFVMSAILDNVIDNSKNKEVPSEICTLDSDWDETQTDEAKEPELDNKFSRQLAQIQMTVKFKEITKKY